MADILNWGSWKDGLSGASFRGASFHVLSTETHIGRNIKVNPTPTTLTPNSNSTVRTSKYSPSKTGEQRTGGGKKSSSLQSERVSGVGEQPATRFTKNIEANAATIQDKGRLPEKFLIEGFVIQNNDNDYDYFKERDALIEALSTYGPGQLVHPFLGDLNVFVAEPAVIEESFKEGGMAKFRMTFIEAGRGTTEVVPNYIYRIDSLSDLLSDLGLDSLVSVLETAMTAVNVLQDGIAMLEKVAATITKIKGAISSAVAKITGAIAHFITIMDTILDAPCDFLNALKSAADAFKNVIGMGDTLVSGGITGGCSGTVRSNKAVYTYSGISVDETLGVSLVTEMATMTDFDYATIGEITTDEGFIARTTISNGFKLFVFLSLAQIAIRIEFTNRETMVALIELVASSMDNFMDEMGAQNGDAKNDDIFMAMQSIRGEFVSSMYGQGKNIVSLIEYTVPQDTLPALVLSYKQYGTLVRDQEIIDFNTTKVRHPGFLPPGETISILGT